jgi:hypothetical protein
MYVTPHGVKLSQKWSFVSFLETLCATEDLRFVMALHGWDRDNTVMNCLGTTGNRDCWEDGIGAV